MGTETHFYSSSGPVCAHDVQCSPFKASDPISLITDVPNQLPVVKRHQEEEAKPSKTPTSLQLPQMAQRHDKLVHGKRVVASSFCSENTGKALNRVC